MKLTMTEMLVLVETLRASLSVHDSGYYFKYRKETREQLLDILLKRMNEVNAAKVITPDVDSDEKC